VNIESYFLITTDLLVLDGSRRQWLSIRIADKCHGEFTAVRIEGSALITSLSGR